MADRIGAIDGIVDPFRHILQLGAKRGASVLWKAVVKGHSKGVELTFAKNASDKRCAAMRCPEQK